MTATLQLRSNIGTRALCAQFGVCASTLRRWQHRAAQGMPLLQQSGPKKKPGPLPLDEVRREIEELLHAQKRSRGTGPLYRRYGEVISRRDLGRRVQQQRQLSHRAQRNNYQYIRWHQPNLAWAIDATEYGKDRDGRRLFLVVTIDLASRYAFAALATLDPTGEAIAAHLRALFRRHGRPFLLKRDNGSIFNNHAVDQLLAEEAVIPLNSPALSSALQRRRRKRHPRIEAQPPALPSARAALLATARHRSLRPCRRPPAQLRQATIPRRCHRCADLPQLQSWPERGSMPGKVMKLSSPRSFSDSESVC